jgi:hypothetical protein
MLGRCFVVSLSVTWTVNTTTAMTIAVYIVNWVNVRTLMLECAS